MKKLKTLHFLLLIGFTLSYSSLVAAAPQWVPAKDGIVPSGAVIGGKEGGRDLPVCRALDKDKNLILGKVALKHCYVGWYGKEIPFSNYEVLVADPKQVNWVKPQGGTVPPNAFMGGKEKGQDRPVCRATYQGMVEPGKLAGKVCYFGLMGKEVAEPNYEVLVMSAQAPQATAKVASAPSSPVSKAIIDKATALVGEYENHLHDGKPTKNDWHYVTISRVNATTFKWTNRAKVSWTLMLTPDEKTLNVGPDSPYANKGHKLVMVKWDAKGNVVEITGPGDKPYQKNVAPVATAQSAPAPTAAQGTPVSRAIIDKAAALVGEYENHTYDGKPAKNDYHYVNISRVNATTFKWTNRAKVSWTLTLTPDRNKLNVGPDTPYANKGHKLAMVKWDAKGNVVEISGPGNAPYQKNVARVATAPTANVQAAQANTRATPPKSPQQLAAEENMRREAAAAAEGQQAQNDAAARDAARRRMAEKEARGRAMLQIEAVAKKGLFGDFQNQPSATNDWHYVTISQIDATNFKWTNRAKVSWTLTLTENKNVLNVGSDSPYYNKGHRTANLKWDANGNVVEITGPSNSSYTKVAHPLEGEYEAAGQSTGFTQFITISQTDATHFKWTHSKGALGNRTSWDIEYSGGNELKHFNYPYKKGEVLTATIERDANGKIKSIGGHSDFIRYFPRPAGTIAAIENTQVAAPPPAAQPPATQPLVFTGQEYVFETVENMETPTTIRDISAGVDGSVFALSTAANPILYRWAGNKWATFHTHGKWQNSDNRVAVDPSGNPWNVLNNRLFFWNAGGWREQSMPVPVQDVAIGPDKSIWTTGTDGKLYYVRAGAGTAVPNGAAGNSRVAVDPLGNAWMARSSGGIAQVDKLAGEFMEYPTPAKAIDMAIGKNGERWMIGSDNRIYEAVSFRQWAEVKLPVNMAGWKFVAVSVDNVGNPWLVRDNGTVFRARMTSSNATSAAAGANEPDNYKGRWAKSPNADVNGFNVQSVQFVNGVLMQIEAFKWGVILDSNSSNPVTLDTYSEVSRDGERLVLDKFIPGKVPSLLAGSGFNAGKNPGTATGTTVTLDFKDNTIGIQEDLKPVRKIPMKNARSVSGHVVSKVIFGRNGQRIGTILNTDIPVSGVAQSTKAGLKLHAKFVKSWKLAYEDGRPPIELTEIERSGTRLKLEDVEKNITRIDLSNGAVSFIAPDIGTTSFDILQAEQVTGFNLGYVTAFEGVQGLNVDMEMAFVKTGFDVWQRIDTQPPRKSVTQDGFDVPEMYKEVATNDKQVSLKGTNGGGDVEIDLEKNEIRQGFGQSMATGAWKISSVKAAAPELLYTDRPKPPKPFVARTEGPGFQIYNNTMWPLTMSVDQVGPLYYGLVNPGETFDRNTGAVWFTLNAQPSPDGVCALTDLDVALPIIEITAQVLFAAVTGGYGAFALASSAGASTGAALATAGTQALVQGATQAAVQGVRVGLEQAYIAAGFSGNDLIILNAATSMVTGVAGGAYKKYATKGLRAAARTAALRQAETALASGTQLAVAGSRTLKQKVIEKLRKRLLKEASKMVVRSATGQPVISTPGGQPPSEPFLTASNFEQILLNELDTLTDEEAASITELEFVNLVKDEFLAANDFEEPEVLFFAEGSTFPMSTMQGAQAGQNMFQGTTVKLQGRYAGPPWPFTEKKPVYEVTGGPYSVVEKQGNKTYVRIYKKPFEMRLIYD